MKLFLLSWAIALLALPASASEAALDQPAAWQARWANAAARLEALQQLRAPRVIFPPGLVDFVTQATRQPELADQLAWPFRGLSAPGAGETYRECLDQTCGRLGLRWRYDTGRDAVLVDFAWRTDAACSLPDLIRAACFTQPTGMFGNGWIQRKWGPVTVTENDRALRAFDALVSAPENFPGAWKLRFLEGLRGPLAPTFIWRGTLRDADGSSRHLFIRFLTGFPAPGPPAAFACYSFNNEGRFLSGALLGDEAQRIEAPSLVRGRDGAALYLFRRNEIVGTINLQSARIVLRPAHPQNGDGLGRALWRSP